MDDLWYGFQCPSCERDTHAYGYLAENKIYGFRCRTCYLDWTFREGTRMRAAMLKKDHRIYGAWKEFLGFLISPPETISGILRMTERWVPDGVITMQLKPCVVFEYNKTGRTWLVEFIEEERFSADDLCDYDALIPALLGRKEGVTTTLTLTRTFNQGLKPSSAVLFMGHGVIYWKKQEERRKVLNNLGFTHSTERILRILQEERGGRNENIQWPRCS